jgi:hypothetical protein
MYGQLRHSGDANAFRTLADQPQLKNCQDAERDEAVPGALMGGK